MMLSPVAGVAIVIGLVLLNSIYKYLYGGDKSPTPKSKIPESFRPLRRDEWSAHAVLSFLIYLSVAIFPFLAKELYETREMRHWLPVAIIPMFVLPPLSVLYALKARKELNGQKGKLLTTVTIFFGSLTTMAVIGRLIKMYN